MSALGYCGDTGYSLSKIQREAVVKSSRSQRDEWLRDADQAAAGRRGFDPHGIAELRGLVRRLEQRLLEENPGSLGDELAFHARRMAQRLGLPSDATMLTAGFAIEESAARHEIEAHYMKRMACGHVQANLTVTGDCEACAGGK